MYDDPAILKKFLITIAHTSYLEHAHLTSEYIDIFLRFVRYICSSCEEASLKEEIKTCSALFHIIFNTSNPDLFVNFPSVSEAGDITIIRGTFIRWLYGVLQQFEVMFGKFDFLHLVLAENREEIILEAGTEEKKRIILAKYLIAKKGGRDV